MDSNQIKSSLSAESSLQLENKFDKMLLFLNEVKTKLDSQINDFIESKAQLF